jgi:integrase
MMTKSYFSGPFAELCEQFVTQKRATGVLYDSQAKRLRQFDNFCKDYDIQNYSVTEELVAAYCIRRPNESDASRRDRIYIVRTFADFLARQGFTSYVLPELPKRGMPHKPYIFTKDEIHRIFKCLDDMAISSFSTGHLVFPTLFRILYGCGLRISEALSLLKSDLDLENEVLHIKSGKNRHERITPMSRSLAEECRRFILTAHGDTSDETPLFYNKNRTVYARVTIVRHFRNILWDVGIPYLGLNAGPRVHDFRHTFMCHNIHRWAEEGVPIYSKLPILSKYVGHTSVSATQWYLRLTAEVYPHIREICERELGGMYVGILQSDDSTEGCEDE